MTTLSASFEGEQPSFEDITLYQFQLCYWKVTHIYGLTQEEIETLITNPDPQTPSHHQVDLRIIKAYLTGESIPTYLPGHLLSRHLESFQRIFLGIDSFLVSGSTFGPRSILPGLLYMEAQVGCKYKGH
jgi:hypothetical protein